VPINTSHSDSRVGDTIAVLRALRRGPVTVLQVAESTGIHWRKVYRIVHDLDVLGAPLKESEGDRINPSRRAPTAYALTVDGLREWLG
jgi:predicted DNA-binding transcriptional regulator YafY